MPTFNSRVLMLTAGALLATSACGGNATVPSGAVSAPGASSVVPDDTTSILKKLKKDVEIGSTVDPKNGDMGPRAISLVSGELRAQERAAARLQLRRLRGHGWKRNDDRSTRSSPELQAGDLCAKHKIEGCDGDAITAGNDVYGAGSGQRCVSEFTQAGKFKKSYGSPIQVPFADADAYCGEAYAPEDLYVGDSKTGAIIKLAFSR